MHMTGAHVGQHHSAATIGCFYPYAALQPDVLGPGPDFDQHCCSECWLAGFGAGLLTQTFLAAKAALVQACHISSCSCRDSASHAEGCFRSTWNVLRLQFIDSMALLCAGGAILWRS